MQKAMHMQEKGYLSSGDLTDFLFGQEACVAFWGSSKTGHNGILSKSVLFEKT